MKNALSKTLGAAVLSLGMALSLTSPASAQTNSTPGTTDGGTTTTTTYDRTANNDGFDWGWLGLLGLAGLAGLAGRRGNDETTRYRDPSAPGASSYRE